MRLKVLFEPSKNCAVQTRNVGLWWARMALPRPSCCCGVWLMWALAVQGCFPAWVASFHTSVTAVVKIGRVPNDYEVRLLLVICFFNRNYFEWVNTKRVKEPLCILNLGCQSKYFDSLSEVDTEWHAVKNIQLCHGNNLLRDGKLRGRINS